VFLTLMVIGLAGLLVMAMPAIGRLGHAHSAHGPSAHGHPSAVGHATIRGPALGTGRAASTAVVRGDSSALIPADPTFTTLLRLIPSPRAICSVLALYGAFGNALVHGAHLAFVTAALVAAVPAFVVERFAVKPIWNMFLRFQGQPSSPLDELIFSEAQAVVPFRNGRGLVSTVRDGRLVQLAAQLCQDHSTATVKVGRRLRIESVDAPRERVTVSVLDD
jgi:hypothetical protein